MDKEAKKPKSSKGSKPTAAQLRHRKDVDTIVETMSERMILMAQKAIGENVTPAAMAKDLVGLIGDFRALVEVCPGTAAGLLSTAEQSLQVMLAIQPPPPVRRTRRTAGGRA